MCLNFGIFFFLTKSQHWTQTSKPNEKLSNRRDHFFPFRSNLRLCIRKKNFFPRHMCFFPLDWFVYNFKQSHIDFGSNRNDSCVTFSYRCCRQDKSTTKNQKHEFHIRLRDSWTNGMKEKGDLEQQTQDGTEIMKEERRISYQ